jgi:MYXO-CTERM domain-containing protein
MTMAAAAFAAGAASADVLYNNPAGTGNFVDQEFGDYPTYSTYQVADVTFASGSVINQITVYTTVGIGNWGGITQARLNLFTKTGALPLASDDPTAGTLVNATWSNGLLVASGLNIPVSGAMWVGLTAVGDFGAVGQEFHLCGTSVSGDPDAYRNPGGSFGLPAGTNWGDMTSGAGYRDIAMTIEGVVPAPGAMALLGLAGIAARRRRRA